MKRTLFVLAGAILLSLQGTHAQIPIYREVFGNSTNVSSANVLLSTVGWFGAWGATATDSSNPSPNNFGISASVGRPTNLDNVNAGGPAATTINGYLFTSGTGASLNNWIAYQNTYTVNTAVTPIQTISFYCASATNAGYGIPGTRIAVQIGGNWYVTSQVFSNTVGVSAGSGVAAGAQQQIFTWTTAASAWNSLTFVPGTSLAMGSVLTSPLPGGNITAFGWYSDQEPGGGNATRRFDTFEIDTSGVAVPPTAGFYGSPTNGPAALPVTFTDTSSGIITNWSWTFGDGGTTNLTTAGVAYTYNTPGVYSVTEIVTGPGGSSTNTASNYITVLATPVANFTATPTNGTAPLAVTFTDTSSGTITNWSWTFGDGGTTNLTTAGVAHTYNTPGIYSVTEIVTGPGGSSTNTASNYITVSPPAPPYVSQYVLKVSGSQIMLNGQSVKILGLRCANATISDAKTAELIANLDGFKSYGVNTIYVYIMGSRFGDIQGYRPDASLDPIYAGRLGQIIQAANQRGMIVLVGCLYWGTSTANSQLGSWTQTDANKAISNTVQWLKNNNYRNVFVDPDNEGMAHVAKGWSISQMIDAGHAVDNTFMIAYNCTDPAPANADLCIHYSPVVSGKPWLNTEATPNNAPDGGYWNAYSKQTYNGNSSYYNYSRIGRYTSAMKTDQINQTISGYQNFNGIGLASTWLQCGAYAVNGPFMTPGGLATNENVDVNIDVLNPDAGILWWLQYIQGQYGAWNPPPAASLTATPTNGAAALTVTFTDTATGGTITNWSWTFGDGGTTNVTTNIVTHTYNTPGTYSVTEIVTGPGGSITNTASNYITVLAPVPPAPPVVTQAFFTPDGSNIVLRGTSGSPTGMYEVVTATDVEGSLSNWPAISTNVFDLTGNFAVTNPVSPLDSKRFYRILTVTTNSP